MPHSPLNDRGDSTLQGLCGHQNLPLAGVRFGKEAGLPWHFQYDIRTGENLYPRRVYPLNALPHLRQQICSCCTYPVRVVVDEDASGSAAAKPLQDIVNAANEVIPDNLGKPVSR